MLNSRKVRLMSRLSMYEKKEGKKDIRLSKYYKTDFVRLNIIKTIISVTFAYILILALVGIYKSEYLIANAVTLDYKMIGMRVLGIYIVLMIVYIIGTLIGYSAVYNKSRSKIARYYRMLGRLRQMYREDEGVRDGEEESEE